MYNERYKSESSAHASASVGDRFKSSTRALIASHGLSRDLKIATRLFDIGYALSGNGH